LRAAQRSRIMYARVRAGGAMFTARTVTSATPGLSPILKSPAVLIVLNYGRWRVGGFFWNKMASNSR
jgi:hypothetical protein